MLEFEISSRDVESGARRRAPRMERTDRVQLALDERLLFMFVRASGVESGSGVELRAEPTYTGPNPERDGTRRNLYRWLPVAVLAAALAIWGLVWLLFG
jgi:hypothetical protein